MPFKILLNTMNDLVVIVEELHKDHIHNPWSHMGHSLLFDEYHHSSIMNACLIYSIGLFTAGIANTSIRYIQPEVELE